ncbi:uncharacterized protein FSUBG_7835 [Fusarium subglutinans]|uniref:Uncharacterized protein n=1 Tax=Gibberella subglutinans TaxID=42677 RepID=A0A8H5PS86_GIBSU|nr:uncharacterized protein FSUBG_7835 [Fusarium subglutinans]KAF5602160.1 hypothetical protein FSUBG_7835 [Fusarium subglutinans]
MCPITFWMHECFFCGAVKDNASRYDPAITTTCPGCNTPVEEKLEWRYWICPPCEEERATDERKYPPRGQPPQQRARAYMFPNETQPQNGTQRQGEPRFQAAPRFQDAPRYQQLQNNPGGRHPTQQYPAQQEEQRPQYFQMGQPPRGQDEPRRQGRRESRRESHGHHHHDHYY